MMPSMEEGGFLFSVCAQPGTYRSLVNIKRAFEYKYGCCTLIFKVTLIFVGRKLIFNGEETRQ